MGYDIHAMSFAEILDTGFRLVRNHFTVLVGIPAVVCVPWAVLIAQLSDASIASQGAGSPLAAIVLLLGILLLWAVGWPVVIAALTFAIGEIYLGRPASVGQSLRVAASAILPLSGTMLLYSLVLIVGFLLLVLPGIYMSLAFLLIWPVMMLEKAYGLAALRRSRELMRGNLLRAFGLLFLGGLIVALLTGVLDLALGYVPLVGSIGSGIASAAGFAYTTSVAVLLYFDVRCRKEAFDLDHLAGLVAARAASAGATAS